MLTGTSLGLTTFGTPMLKILISNLHLASASIKRSEVGSTSHGSGISNAETIGPGAMTLEIDKTSEKRPVIDASRQKFRRYVQGTGRAVDTAVFPLQKGSNSSRDATGLEP
jgi:hypothetical protein